jgi:outer membrane protein OmpA-like peptidoglycan-associated protein
VVELTGGCCPLGTDEYNDLLGFRRAAAVREAIGVGVCRSVGERHLVTADPAEYWRNRRCEIVVRW